MFQEKDGEKTAVILITSDRGLCGGFNTNLCKRVLEQFGDIPTERLTMTMIGRKGFDYFKRRSYEILGNFQETRPEDQINVVREVISQCIRRYENGELNKVYLAYNHYRSVISQKPVIEQLIPIPKIETESPDEREVSFEPSPEAILDRLLDKFLENRVYVSWLDSNAGEHAARMTAMDSATKNAGDMIDKLQLTYNRTRQAAITTELIEIISGPFTTSTMQQSASSKLGFGASRTMQIAQRLYQGIEIEGETKGLITYMRTDGTNLSS